MFDFLTNAVFCLSFLADQNHVWGSMAYIGGGAAIVGGSGAGVGQGYAGGKLIEATSRNPEVEKKAFTQFLIASAIAESCAIYALVISVILIFVEGNAGQN